MQIWLLCLITKQGRAFEISRQAAIDHAHCCSRPRSMELDMEIFPYQSRLDPRQQWSDSLSSPPVAVSPPQSNFVPSSPPSFYSRRRSTAAILRPAGPPPDVPIPSLPPTATTTNQLGHFVPETQSATYTTRSTLSSSFGRPTASP